MGSYSSKLLSYVARMHAVWPGLSYIVTIIVSTNQQTNKQTNHQQKKKKKKKKTCHRVRGSHGQICEFLLTYIFLTFVCTNSLHSIEKFDRRIQSIPWYVCIIRGTIHISKRVWLGFNSLSVCLSEYVYIYICMISIWKDFCSSLAFCFLHCIT